MPGDRVRRASLVDPSDQQQCTLRCGARIITARGFFPTDASARASASGGFALRNAARSPLPAPPVADRADVLDGQYRRHSASTPRHHLVLFWPSSRSTFVLRAAMGDRTGEGALRLDFDRSLLLQSRGSAPDRDMGRNAGRRAHRQEWSSSVSRLAASIFVRAARRLRGRE